MIGETYVWQNEGSSIETAFLEDILQQNFKRVFSVIFKKNSRRVEINQKSSECDTIQ